MGWTQKRTNETGLQTDIEWLRQWLEIGINVKQFGAIGDGSHDDTRAIQDAEARATTIGTALVFPEGLYQVSSKNQTFNCPVIMQPRAQAQGTVTWTFLDLFHAPENICLLNPLVVAFPPNQRINAYWFGSDGAAIVRAISSGNSTFTHVYIPPHPTAATWQFIATLTLPDRAIHIEGNATTDYTGRGTILEFTQIDGTDGLVTGVTGAGQKIQSLRLSGNVQAGKGIYLPNTGRSMFRDIHVQGFGGGGIHLNTSYTNKFQNCEFRSNGEYGIRITSSNENEFIQCHSIRHTIHDVFIESGTINTLDVSHSAFVAAPGYYTSPYAIRMGNGAIGNRVYGFHDGGHKRIAQFDTQTLNNRVEVTAPLGSYWSDSGVNNTKLNLRGELAQKASPDTVPAATNLLRNSSLTRSASGWVVSGAVTAQRVTDEGGATRTAIEVTFPRGAGGGLNGLISTTLTDSAWVVGDRVYISFWARLKSGTPNDFDIFQLKMTNGFTTFYPNGGTWPYHITTRWQRFEAEFLCIINQSPAVPMWDVYFDSGTGDNFVMLLTDVMCVKNPANSKNLPFIWTGTQYNAINYPNTSRMGMLPVRQAGIMEEVPVNPQPGEIYLADGFLFNPLVLNRAGAYETLYNAFNITSTYFGWTISGAGPEYYLHSTTNTHPGIPLPLEVFVNGALATRGTKGSLAVGEWDYADEPALGARTVYARVTGDVNPSTLGNGYISARFWTDLSGNKRTRGIIAAADGDQIPHGLSVRPQYVTVTPTVRNRVASVISSSHSAFQLGLTDLLGNPIAVAENVYWEAVMLANL